MDKNNIEYLAYLLNKAKKENSEKAIVFIGAGTSVSAGIPTTNVIIRHIKLKFKNNPFIKKSNDLSYYEIMGLLTADERRDLFHFYVTRKKVKLNVANVYLAQLLKEEYIDYIVTVNFDNLIQKACAIYNFLPPVYDISNLKTITTTDLRTGSVIYLHGQYFGQWLLNNNDELKKVETEVSTLFNTIKTRRTWIVVGYSGNDGIFEKIKSLGSFSNDLYWVKRTFNPDNDKHVIDFTNNPILNTRKIEGFDADGFFIKLHSELKKLNNSLNDPEIFFKPFTLLKSFIQKINTIQVNESDTNDINNYVRNIVSISKNRIEKAIQKFETNETLEKVKQKINSLIINSTFDKDIAESIEHEIDVLEYKEALIDLSLYYNVWAEELQEKAYELKDRELFKECFKTYEKAIYLDSNNYRAYNDYANALTKFGYIFEDKISIINAIELFKKSLEISENLNLNEYIPLTNMAFSVSRYADFDENMELYEKALEIYSKSIFINPYYFSSYNGYVELVCRISHLLDDDKKTELFPKAKNAGLIAYSLNKHDCSYNYSCILNLSGEKMEALKFLDESLENKSIDVNFVLKDKDWDNLLDDIHFKKIIAKYS